MEQDRYTIPSTVGELIEKLKLFPADLQLCVLGQGLDEDLLIPLDNLDVKPGPDGKDVLLFS